MTNPSSYQTIVRSSSIIGGAQIINVLSGIFKMKAVALLLGPIGVGAIGLYINLVQTASAVAALGLGTVGTRQIAVAKAESGDVALGHVRRSLFWLTFLLAIAGGLVFWVSTDWLSQFLALGSEDEALFLWLALGVTSTVIASFYTALLTGMRQVAKLALVTISTAVSAAVIGVAAIWFLGEQGIIILVLTTPFATLLFGQYFVSRLSPAAGPHEGVTQLVQRWPELIRLGVPFMLSGIVTVVGQLVVRGMVQRELGPEALGHFQASWAIGMMYVGYVLGAMSTDFYPRLTASIRDSDATAHLVNEQTEVALLLCAPVLLLMLGLAPEVITLLYSAEFQSAADILRWQILGDVLKVMSFPLGYLLLARGAGKSFILAECLGVGFFVLVTWIGLPLTGVTAAGIGFLAMYLVYLPIVWWLAMRSSGFRWSIAVLRYCIALSLASLCTFWISQYNPSAAALLGLFLALLAGVYAAKTLSAHLEQVLRIRPLLEKMKMKLWR